VTRLEVLRRRLNLEPVAARTLLSPRITMMTDTVSTIAAVPTDSGSRYLQQLCKHWSHNLKVEFTAEYGTVTFPRDIRGADYPGDAVATFDAHDGVLDVRIDASSTEQRDALKGVVASHLDRFAFREAPLSFDWRDA
jgi:uncharacterized protein